MSTHAKLYSRVCESSLTSAPKMAQLAFFYLLAIADKKGQVIGTDERLSARICFEPADFTAAIAVLTSPDEQSSSKAHEGRRLLPIVEPRGYRIVNYRQYQGAAKGEADPERCPTTPAALKIAEIFNRRPTTAWADGEITKFKSLAKVGAWDLDELEIVHRYYLDERKKSDPRTGRENGIHRRDLSTFLNNYLESERDRARGWAARNPALARRAIKQPTPPADPTPEPPGFRQWWQSTYPKADPTLEFHRIPADLRAQFSNQNTK